MEVRHCKSVEFQHFYCYVSSLNESTRNSLNDTTFWLKSRYLKGVIQKLTLGSFGVWFRAPSSIIIYSFLLSAQTSGCREGCEGGKLLPGIQTHNNQSINRWEIRISDHSCFHEDGSALESRTPSSNTWLNIWDKKYN